ncbi:hypothetical protein ACU4HD_43955 [Cupriavidus basilensis]
MMGVRCVFDGFLLAASGRFVGLPAQLVLYRVDDVRKRLVELGLGGLGVVAVVDVVVDRRVGRLDGRVGFGFGVGGGLFLLRGGWGRRRGRRTVVDDAAVDLVDGGHGVLQRRPIRGGPD